MAGTPQPYLDAVRRARATMGALDEQAASAIARALADYADELEVGLRELPRRERPAIAKSVEVIRGAAAQLDFAIAGAVGQVRAVGFDETLRIWREATQRVARAEGVPHALLGAVETGQLTEAASFEALGAADTWRTLLRDHVEHAAGEATRIVRQGIVAGLSPEEIARGLRPYVLGAEDIRKLFPDGAIDLRQIPPELRGAAKQMRYNAERIAFSEVHNARAEAETRHFQADPLVEAVQWELSPNRGKAKVPDICDVLASQDLYGLGPGVYPVDRVPPSPHPFDRCERVPVTRDVEDADQPKPNPELQVNPHTVHIPGGEHLTDRGRERIRQQLADLTGHTPGAAGGASGAGAPTPPVAPPVAPPAAAAPAPTTPKPSAKKAAAKKAGATKPAAAKAPAAKKPPKKQPKPPVPARLAHLFEKTYASPEALAGEIVTSVGPEARVKTWVFNSQEAVYEQARGFWDEPTRTIYIAPDVTAEVAPILTGGPGSRRPDALNGTRTLVHETLHSTSPMLKHDVGQYQIHAGRHLEEAIVEHRARGAVAAAWDRAEGGAPLPGAYLALLDRGYYAKWVRTIDWVAAHGGDAAVERIWQAKTAAARAQAASDIVWPELGARLRAVGFSDAEVAATQQALGNRAWRVLLWDQKYSSLVIERLAAPGLTMQEARAYLAWATTI